MLIRLAKVIRILILCSLLVGCLGCSGKEESPQSEFDILFQVQLRYQFDIFRYHTEGTYPDSIATLPGEEVMPIWSPDHQRFVFSHAREEHFDVAIADADGSNLQYVTADTFDNVNIASWHPAGDRIFFSSRRGGQTDIYSIRTDGTMLTPIVTDTSNQWHPIVTPNGRRLLFMSDRTRRPRIWGMELATGEVAFAFPPDPEYTDLDPAISPDGKFLAHARVKIGGDPRDVDIVLRDLVNNTVEVIVDTPSVDRYPRFSPDGRRILFHSNRTGTDALYYYDRDTKSVSLVPTSTINASFGDW